MATVNVGCKLPSGLTIRLGERHEKEGDGRDAVLNVVEAGTELRLIGAGADDAMFGFGITRDVDADLMNDWMDRHKSFPPVKNGLIFIAKDAADTKAKAKDAEGQKTGIEPLPAEDPGSDPRAGIKPGSIAPDKEAMAKKG